MTSKARHITFDWYISDQTKALGPEFQIEAVPISASLPFSPLSPYALYFFSLYFVSLKLLQTPPSTLPARIRPLKRPNWPVFDPGKASTVCWRSIIIARDSGALFGTDFGHALQEWRGAVHTRDLVARNFPSSYILDDNPIAQLARAVSGSFRIPNDVTDFLGETPEWHAKYALEIVTIIRQHDLTVLPAHRRRDASSSSGPSDSETSQSSNSSSEWDSNGDEIPTPTQEDFGTVISVASLHSSPSSSRVSSPTDPPAVSSSGRPLRQSAINYKVAGIAERLVKKKRV
ncbi:hypothetical protein K438DRAFT_1764537 [Mycena galopus ATCC 62051]|nr:hypothetical protein K438DRAFT_1764537 [Mycena galopus ATCC 62051]